MTGPHTAGPLVIGPDHPVVAELAHALGADVDRLPPVQPVADDHAWGWAEPLERWRDRAAAAWAVDAVVVSVPAVVTEPRPLAAVDPDEWTERVEGALATGVAALGAAKARCADGGAVVAVVDRPPPLDSAGWAPESGVADAVEALARSLARSEGPRGVRVNVVTGPGRVLPERIVAPAPSLPTFPGRLDAEVAGAVRLLLAPDASGITGTVVHADCGRSWR